MNRAEQLRLDARLTQIQLADKAGIDRRTVGRIEQGKPVTVAALAAVADVLTARPSELQRPAIFEHPSEVPAA